MHYGIKHIHHSTAYLRADPAAELILEAPIKSAGI
jgi:hypothetical protein